MLYALLADALVVVHLGIVLFVIFGQLLILVGWPLRWSWVRNLTFRATHFVIMAVVAVQAGFGVLCPLTIWEVELRKKAGQVGFFGVEDEQLSFVGRLAREVLFLDPEVVSMETLTKCYYGFTALVVLSLVCVPPRRRRARSREAATGSTIDPGGSA